MIVVVLKFLLIFYGRIVLYKRKYLSIKVKIYGIFFNYIKVNKLKRLYLENVYECWYYMFYFFINYI